MDLNNVLELYQESKKYELVSSAELVNLFKDQHLFFPDFINRFIILNVLKKHIFKKEVIETFPPEFVYKLKNYNYFSVYLLINTIEKYNIKIESKEYKNMFMRFFLKNQKKFKITDKFEKKLETYKEKIGPQESIIETLKSFQDLFYTPKGYLDGISLSIIKDAICATYNISDIIDLSKLNGVTIPNRLNKSELLSLISRRLLLTDEEKDLLSKKPITDICLYAKQKGFKISPDLKKAEIVEYLVYSLGKYHEDTEKDLYSYDILVSEDESLESVEQVEVEHTQQDIPVSSNFVEAQAPESTTPIIKEEPVEEAEPIVTPPKKEETIKEQPKEETKDNTPIDLKEDMENVIYYDTQVDQEIRDIIKKYYSKKKNKDKVFRTSVIVILVLILITSVALLLKILNLF